MFKPSIFFLTAACIAATTIATAQTVPDTTIADQQLQPAEVRALRATSNAPFVKTDISGAELQNRNVGQDLPYLLQYTPSALVTSDAGTGIGYTGLRIRGTDGTRINVTLNGVPVNDAESQGTFFVNFPDITSSLSSVQLQRGVGTSTNGAGAFGATMSLSNLENRKDAGADIQVSGGSFNTQRYMLKAGTGLLKGGWQFDLRLSKISSDGYIERSASDLKSLQFLSSWTVSNNTNFKFLLMSGREKTGQAWNGVLQDSLSANRRRNDLGLKSDGGYYGNQTDNYGQDYYQLHFNHRFSNSLNTHVAAFMTRGKGYYEEYKLGINTDGTIGESFGNYGLRPFVFPSGADTVNQTDLIRQLWLDNYYYGATFSLGYEKGKTKLTFGGAYTRYDAKHYGYVKWAQLGVPADYRWYNLTAHKTDLNAYGKAEQTIGSKLILFGDAQVRHVAYDINGFRNNPALHPSVDYTFFNPKAGFSYLVRNNANNKQRAYASIALANKEPNRDDFEANTDALPEPEKLTDIEAGYELQRSIWTASANLYYMRYTDQLVLTGKINDVGAYTRINVPNSYRAGIELVAAVKPIWWLTIGGNVTFSQNKIQDFTEYIDNWDDGGQDTVYHGTTDIAFSPNQIVTGNISFSPLRNRKYNQQVNLELLGKYASRQYLDNTGNNNRSIGAYGVADIRARYSLAIGPFDEVGLQLTVNNIFNRLYESNGYNYSYTSGSQAYSDNYYFPQAGRNVLVGLHVKF